MELVPLISVIVPIYRVENYLDRCVKSIVKQTYTNLEIILVDDGSPDKCPQMCDEWAKKDSRIKVVHKENGGLSDARNFGMQFSTGDFIGFVDSDDWIAPEMYEKLVSVIMIDKSDISACGVEMIWENDSPSRLLNKPVKCLLNKREAQLALLEESLLKQPVWYKLYRRETIIEIPFENGKYHEDVFWSYQAIGNANKVSVIDYIGYYYFQRSGSIMGQKYSLKRLDAVEAKVQRQEYFNKYSPDLLSKGRVDLLYTCLYHGQMSIRFLINDEKKYAINYLKQIFMRYKLQGNDLKKIKFTNRCWLTMGKYFFRATCWLRNLCKVGL